jgi:hypothetical protein
MWLNVDTWLLKIFTYSPLFLCHRKLYIVDARPRKNALANGAKGGGSESSSNYLQSEVCTWPKVVWSSIFCLLELLVLTDNVFSSDCFFGDRQHTCNERELFPP